MLGGWLRRLVFQSLNSIIGKQSLKVVAIRAVAAKSVFVEQSLDPATRANLVSAPLGANRPTHLAVPTTSEDNCRARHPRGQQAHGPEPAGTFWFFRIRALSLVFFHHNTC